MALAAELSKKFKYGNESLSDKLRAAKTMFYNAEFNYIGRKEDIVLEWLLEITDYKEHSDSWQTLRDCLESERMKNMKFSDLKTATKKNLVDVLMQSLKYELNRNQNKTQESHLDRCSWLTECVILVLENKAMLYFFKNNLTEYVTFSHLLLEAAVVNNSDVTFVNYVGSVMCLCGTYPIVPLKFSKLFIKELLFNIVSTYCLFEESVNCVPTTINEDHDIISNIDGHYKEKAPDLKRGNLLILIQTIVFPKRLHETFKTSLLNMFHNGECKFSSILRTLCEKLTQSYEGQNFEVTLYSVLFEAFVLNFQTDLNFVYQFFVLMCSLIHFEPTVELEVEDSELCSLLKQNTYKKGNVNCLDSLNVVPFCILNNMIFILKDLVLIVDETLNEISFKEWLKALIVHVIDICECPYILFSIVNNVSQINPLIIQSIVEEIFMKSLLMRKISQKEKTVYRIFFSDVLSLFVKLSREINLISLILSCLKQVIHEVRIKDISTLCITVSDVIPEEMSLIWANTTKTISVTKSTCLLQAFNKYLMEDLIDPLKNNKYDEGHRLCLGVLEKLVVPFLEEVRVAEQSTLKSSCISFMEALEKQRLLLKELGEGLLLQKHCSESIASFLRMCLATGEVQILLLNYSHWISENPNLHLPRSVDPSNAVGLQCLFSFLSPQQWNEMSERTRVDADESCREAMVALHQQELRVLRLFENKIKCSRELICSISDYLSEDWVLLSIIHRSQDAAELMQLLPPEKMAAIGGIIVDQFAINSAEKVVLELLKSSLVLENISLVSSLVWVCVQRICNLLARNKRKRNAEPKLSRVSFVKKMLRSVDLISLLNPSEKENIKQSLLESSREINDACSCILESDGITKFDTIVSDFSMLSKYLLLLQVLPLPFLPKNVRTSLVLGMLSVLVVLRNLQMKNSPDDLKLSCKGNGSAENNLEVSINKCKEILQGVMDSQVPLWIGDFVDVTLVVRLLLLDGQCPKVLLKRIFESCIREGNLLEKVAKSVVESDEHIKKHVNPDAPPVSVVFFLVLKSANNCRLFHTSKDFRESHAASFKYLLRNISECIRIGMNIEDISETAVLSLLEAYRCVFPHCKSELLPYAERFLNTAVSVLESPNEYKEFVPIAEQLLEYFSKLTSKQGTVYEQCLKVCQSGKWPQLTAKLLVNVSEDDFSKILQDICEQLKTSCNQKDVFPCLQLANILSRTAALSGPKARSVEQMMSVLCRVALEQVTEEECSDNLPEFLQFLSDIVGRTKMSIPDYFGNVALTTITCALKPQGISLEYTVTVVMYALKILSTLMFHYFTLVERYIPAFLQAFQSTVHRIIVQSASNADLTEMDIEKLVNCAFQIELLSNDMAKYPKSFRSVSQYFVADMLLEVQEKEIHRQVKVHIMNCVYSLMKLCDTHAVKHLSFALPPASLEFFKNGYREYKKFYR